MASSRSFWCLRRGHPNQRKLSNHLGFGPNIEVRPGCWASCPDTCESDVGSRSQDVPRVCFKIQSMCARRYADRCVSSKVQYHGQEDIINIATSRRVRSNSEHARADPDDVSLVGSVPAFYTDRISQGIQCFQSALMREHFMVSTSQHKSFWNLRRRARMHTIPPSTPQRNTGATVKFVLLCKVGYAVRIAG